MRLSKHTEKTHTLGLRKLALATVVAASGLAFAGAASAYGQMTAPATQPAPVAMKSASSSWGSSSNYISPQATRPTFDGSHHLNDNRMIGR